MNFSEFLPAKVREFEQVTDISIDKLDELSAQTQQTSKGLETAIWGGTHTSRPGYRHADTRAWKVLGWI